MKTFKPGQIWRNPRRPTWAYDPISDNGFFILYQNIFMILKYFPREDRKKSIINILINNKTGIIYGPESCNFELIYE